MKKEVKITKKDITLGKRIRKYRRKAMLTQEKLAEKARLSITHLGLVEVGRRRISLQALHRIATSLNVKVKDILPF